MISLLIGMAVGAINASILAAAVNKWGMSSTSDEDGEDEENS